MAVYKLTEEMIRERVALWEAGLTDKECAKKLGISKTTYANWRKEYGLPPNRASRAGIPHKAHHKRKNLQPGIPPTYNERRAAEYAAIQAYREEAERRYAAAHPDQINAVNPRYENIFHPKTLEELRQEGRWPL